MTVQPPADTSYPGKTLGIIGLIASVPFNVIGLILSIVALVQSKKAGYKNTPAVIGIIIGSVITIATVIVIIVLVGFAVAAIANCGDLGPGVHQVNGVAVSCS